MHDAEETPTDVERERLRGWMLGIETSAEIVSVALARFDGSQHSGLAELMWPAGRSQTVTLLAQIEHLLTLCGIESDAISAVAVATGPGSFNALRVGMSVAKGFAFAYDIPIVGVGTLDAVAYPFLREGLPVRAFVPAGRGRVVYRDYGTERGSARPDGAMEHRAPADLAADLLTPTLLVGELGLEDAALLSLDPHVILPGAGLRQRSASRIIDLAMARLAQGDVDDLTELEPLYVHQRTPEPAATASGPAAARQQHLGTHA